MRRSTSEPDVDPRRRSKSAWAIGVDDSDDDDNPHGIWVVADPCSPCFGQKYGDIKAIAEKGVTCGRFCLVPGEAAGGAGATRHGGEGAILLQQARSRSNFMSEFYSEARPQIAALEADIKRHMPASADTRTHQRREELSHWDMVEARPPLKIPRILLALLLFACASAAVWTHSADVAPSILTPILVTVGYPLALFGASRVMEARQPAGDFVFEMLLVFDIYHLASSVMICLGVVREASALGMLLPPIGHAATVSSPVLRRLIWWHYCNRVLELLDTIFRISQKKFRAYGALHFYLRLVSVWSWFAATCVGGGDVWFLLASDSCVVSVRFLVFSLSLLQWNVNFEIDFGLHAPKVAVFNKHQLFRLQTFEFALLLAHACFVLVHGNLPRPLMLCQVLVMSSGLAVFTDFYFSRDAEKRLAVKYAGERLMLSFDSSAWLFLWHFGVAMWVEDNIEMNPSVIGYSGSSGGSLVAGTLSAGINAEVLATWVIDNAFPVAGRKPYLLLGQCEQALDLFLPDDAHRTSSDVLRVLLTKVSSSPPFLMGEVVSSFSSWGELFSCLRASCHIPLVGGILPYPVPGHGWYYDGLIWASLFVPWRTFSSNDLTVKCSAYGAPGADIRPSVMLPFWWCIFPPSKGTLLGLMAMGYHDAEHYFRREGSTAKNLARLRSQARASPAPSRLTAERMRLIRQLTAEVNATWRCTKLCAAGLALLLLCFLCTRFLPARAPGPPLAPAAADL